MSTNAVYNERILKHVCKDYKDYDLYVTANCRVAQYSVTSSTPQYYF